MKQGKIGLQPSSNNLFRLVSAHSCLLEVSELPVFLFLPLSLSHVKRALVERLSKKLSYNSTKVD